MLRRLPRLTLYTAALLAAFAFVAIQEAPVRAQGTVSLPASAGLPYAGERAYTGGPHTGGLCSTPAINRASGIDFSGSFEVLAIAEGVFKGTSGMNPGLDKDGQGPLSAGNVVIIEHNPATKLQSQYWHLERFSDGIKQLEADRQRLIKEKKSGAEIDAAMRVPKGYFLGISGHTGNQYDRENGKIVYYGPSGQKRYTSGDPAFQPRPVNHLHVELRTNGVAGRSDFASLGGQVGWDGQVLDDWRFSMHRVSKDGATGYAYQGSAVRKGVETEQLELLSSCRDPKDPSGKTYLKAWMTVAKGWKRSDDKLEELNKLDGKTINSDTVFAFTGGQALPLASHTTKCDNRTTGPCAVANSGGNTGPQPPSTGDPVKTVLVVDTSGSMSRPSGAGGSKLDAAERGARSVVTLIQQEHERHQTPQQIGLVLFNGEVHDSKPLTSTFSDIDDRLDNLAADGATNIYAAIQEGVKLLGPGQRGQKGRSIILMTDGIQEPRRPDADFFAPNGPVDAAINSGITICTIGFGQPGDFNKELLDRIAGDTGCGQMLAAGDEDELQKRYADLRHVTAGGTLIAQLDGDVAQGETVEAGTFAVNSDGQRLMVTLVWPGSTLDLRLLDPRGRVVDSGYKGASIVTTGTTANIIIDRPAKGSWKVQVHGREVSQPREPYYVVASTRPLPASVTPPPDRGSSSQALPIAVGLGMVTLAFGTVAFAWARSREGGGAASAGAPAAAGGLLLGGPGGVTFSLAPGEHLLGREEDCDVRLLDDTVSRRHARLTVAQGRLYVEDLGSTGGTYINGRRTARGVAGPGDTLRAGNTELRVLR